MKKNFKKTNIIIIVIISIFTFYSIYKNYTYYNLFELQHKKIQLEIKECDDTISKSNDVSFINHCHRIKNLQNYKEDFFSTLTNILVYDFSFLNPFAFLLLVIPSLKYISDLLKYKYVINSMTRTSYNSFLKHFYLEAYKYIWLLPLIALIIMLPICLYTTFDPSYANFYGTSMWDLNTMQNPVTFITLYIINIILYSISFINISLIVIRKHHDYIKGLILSYIVYIGIELFFEVIVNELVLKSIFNSQIGYLFNIMNFFTFNTEYGVFNLLLFSFLFCITTFVISFLKYKNKENLIIDCEKNN